MLHQLAEEDLRCEEGRRRLRWQTVRPGSPSEDPRATRPRSCSRSRLGRRPTTSRRTILVANCCCSCCSWSGGRERTASGKAVTGWWTSRWPEPWRRRSNNGNGRCSLCAWKMPAMPLREQRMETPNTAFFERIDGKYCQTFSHSLSWSASSEQGNGVATKLSLEIVPVVLLLHALLPSVTPSWLTERLKRKPERRDSELECRFRS